MMCGRFNIPLFETEVRLQLDRILDYWILRTPDLQNGGFYGAMGEDDKPVPAAAKGAVMHARILWTFSAAYSFLKQASHLETAHRAYQYILDRFVDPDYGGLYWSVSAEGQPLQKRKQIYAQAFGIFSFAEYYRATHREDALLAAIQLFRLVEKYSYDPVQAGYLDAFDQDWTWLADQRLSEKDDNAPKTMNTHLHLVEAYATLYEIWPDPLLKKRVSELLNIFVQRIVASGTRHLRLFFNKDWTDRPGVISYGHDIEAAWLLADCAGKIHADEWMKKTTDTRLAIVQAALEGIDGDGGLWYEYDPVHATMIFEKHWWPQAEFMVGMLNAWQQTKQPRYLIHLFQNWDFIKKNLISITGEWHWGILQDGQLMAGQDKAGFWKCPYHNGRACMEILKRLKEMPIQSF